MSQRPADATEESGPEPQAALVETRKGAADTYTVERAVHQSDDISVYLARSSTYRTVWIVEKPGSTVAEPGPPTPTEDSELTLPLLDQGSCAERTFAVYSCPEDGELLCSGVNFFWDTLRLEVLLGLLESFRAARDSGIFMGDCRWQTAFITHTQEIRWLSPRAMTAPPDVMREFGDNVADSLATPARPGLLERWFGTPPSSGSPPPSASRREALDGYYMGRLKQILPDVVLHNFASPPLITPQQQVMPLLKRSSSSGQPLEFASSVEVKEFLAAILSDRINRLDTALAELDSFGVLRVVRLRSGWGTNQGKVRELNEDALLVLEQSSVICERPLRMVLYAVADGMGGHEAGEIASEITLKALAVQIVGGLNITSAMEHGRDLMDHNFLLQTLATAIEQTNQTLRKYSDDASFSGDRKPGSTLVFAHCFGSVVTVGHVGDSRAYKISKDGTLERITKDHSPVQRLVDSHKITQEEAFTHPYRHQIFSSIGVSPDALEKTLQIRYLKEGDGLILCSDGLSDMLTDADIEVVCKQHTGDPRRLAGQLVAAALAKGGHDNVTVIVVIRPATTIQEQREIATNVAKSSH